MPGGSVNTARSRVSSGTSGFWSPLACRTRPASISTDLPGALQRKTAEVRAISASAHRRLDERGEAVPAVLGRVAVHFHKSVLALQNCVGYLNLIERRVPSRKGLYGMPGLTVLVWAAVIGTRVAEVITGDYAVLIDA